jgi:hypothetical protein
MKRLLLGPALIAPLALFGCNWGTKVPELPKVPEVIRDIPLEDFEAFPTIPVVPPAPAAKPVVRHKPAPHQEKPHARHVPQPTARPVPTDPPVGPVEDLPPQQGLICIFPLNMIPNCTPQVAQ